MTPILKTLSKLFSGPKSGNKEDPVDKDAKAPEFAPTQATIQPPPAEEGFSQPPLMRRVIQAREITPVAAEERKTDEILIKAQPSANGDQCKFMVNKPLAEGFSWFFPDFESAAGSPLAEAIFSNDLVETLLVHDSTLVVTKFGDKSLTEWEPLARNLGGVIRKVLQAGGPLISEEIVRNIPSEETIRAEIQRVIDTEVNPGVAGHGGRITLTKVEGNTVTIEMGGGCQGCSAADMTLKQGIHNSFRNAVPYVGAIYDETDHAAGMNPYYA